MQVFAVEKRSCAGEKSALSLRADNAAPGYCHRQCQKFGCSCLASDSCWMEIRGQPSDSFSDQPPMTDG